MPTIIQRLADQMSERAGPNERQTEDYAGDEANTAPVIKFGFKKVFKSFDLPAEGELTRIPTSQRLRKRRYAQPSTPRRRKHKARDSSASGADALVGQFMPGPVIKSWAASVVSGVSASAPTSTDSTTATAIPNTLGAGDIVDKGPINPLIPVSVALMVVLGMLVFGVIICGLVRHRRHRVYHSEDALEGGMTTPDAEKRQRRVRPSSTLTSFANEIVEHAGSHSTPRVQVTPSTPTRPARSSILGPPLPVMHGRRVAFAAPSTPEYFAHTAWTPDSPTQWEHPHVWSNHLDNGHAPSHPQGPQVYEEYNEASIENRADYESRFATSEDEDAYDGLQAANDVRYADRFSIHSTSSDSSTGSSNYTTASDGTMPETPIHSEFSAFTHPPHMAEHPESPIKTAIVVHPAPRRARSHTVVTLDDKAQEQLGVRMSQVARVEQEIAALEDLLSSESGVFGLSALPGIDEVVEGDDEEEEAGVQDSDSMDSVDELGTVEDVVIARPECRLEMLPPLDFQLQREEPMEEGEGALKLVASPSRLARANTFPAKLLARRFSYAAANAASRQASPPPLAAPATRQRRNSFGSITSITPSFLLPLTLPTIGVKETPPPKCKSDTGGQASLAPSISHRFSACSWDEYLDSLDLYHRGTEMDGGETMEEIERRRLTIKSLDLAKFPMPSTELPSIRVTSH